MKVKELCGFPVQKVTYIIHIWGMDSSKKARQRWKNEVETFRAMPEGHLQSPSSNRPRRLCKNMILHLEAVYLHAKDDQLQVSQSSHQGPRPHTPESACVGAVQPKSDLSRLCRFLCAVLTQIQNFKKRTWTRHSKTGRSAFFWKQ